MAKRITIMMGNVIDKKLRKIQAKMIEQTQGSYSYSRVLNEVLEKALR